MAGILALAPVVLIAGCASGPKHKPGDEFVKTIRFEGNKDIKNKTLKDGLALHRAQKRGTPPDPYLIQVDEDRIRGEYLRKGYLDVDVRSRVERKGDANTIIYTVEEGVRANTKVVINGIPNNDPDLSVDQVRKMLPLEDGARFDYQVYDLAKQNLMTVVEDAGYAHAKLDATVYADRANHEAIIQLDYDLGPKCKFGTIEVTGVRGDLIDAVRNRVKFQTGDQYSTSAIVATQRNLYAFGRFSTVQVQPDESPSPTVNVRIAVAQAARHEVKLGGGFGLDPTAYEVRGRAGYTVAGWPFDLDTVSLELRPAYAILRDGSGYEPRIRSMAKLERQDLLWTYAKGEVEGGYNYLAVEAYTSYGPRARLGFSTPLGWDKLQLRAGWGIERLDFRNISPLIDPTLQMQLGLDHTELDAAYQQALVLDLRNHPIEPTLGAYAEVRVQEGTKYAGGDYDYVEVVPEARGYLTLPYIWWGHVTLAGKLRYGTFFGDVPVTDRFFSGGASNHRGFGERKLSPYVQGDVDGSTRYVPYGGTTMLETGIEARIPITTWRKMGVGTVLFLDGGDVTEERSDLDPTNLYWAAGLGLRLHTLVGPVRADLGYRLNRTGEMDAAPGSRFAFHLSLGEAF
ncbi:MAG TPA: BamA/TamA family outer membrane protein [Kofleriaceae bacterium]|nr:BamA/TamA family outer membrane protein [Kofleriaceae bacterium]